jgi:hypothetical protein
MVTLLLTSKYHLKFIKRTCEESVNPCGGSFLVIEHYLDLNIH